jgi:phosphoribosylformimino-5-aminoimidazole carboxamide ribotide isomerase
MIVLPAIDLRNNRVVRLKQGDPEQETVYGDDPVSVAQRWEAAGAMWLHVVDLDGAFEGEPKQKDAIRSIVENTSMSVELGGGIRDLATIESYLEIGVKRVIIGTAAFDNPELIAEAVAKYPGQIAAGIDAKDGKVALRGWKDITDIDAVDFAKKIVGLGASPIIYTDIGRDGMQTGANAPATASLALNIDAPVIISGGVADIEDIKVILHHKKHGIAGIITGRAIYEGTLDLAEAISLCGDQSKKF